MANTIRAQWTWDTSGAFPVPTGFVNNSPTKSGLMPADLEAFLGTTLQWGTGTVPQPSAIPPATSIQWIRWAEDQIQSDHSLPLCPTQIASAPEETTENAVAAGIGDVAQQIGVDYDFGDAAYDFYYERYTGEGWGMIQTVWKSIISLDHYSFIYPLLNEYFQVPGTWLSIDKTHGLIRLVPSKNILMLPLFAVEISALGFAQNVPGAVHMQYTAGVQPHEYYGVWSYLKRYILVQAAIQALISMQIAISGGAASSSVSIDGLNFSVQYPKGGTFGGTIDRLIVERTQLYSQAALQLGPVTLMGEM